MTIPSFPKNFIIYNQINSFFAKNKEYIQILIQKYIENDVDNFLNKDLKKLLIKKIYDIALSRNSNNIIDIYEEEIIKKYIDNTFNFFLQNKHKGSGLIVSLFTSLLDIAINLQNFKKTNLKLYRGIKIFTSVVKRHSYGWFYYAYNTNKNFYLDNNFIIPFSKYIIKNKLSSFYYKNEFPIDKLIDILYNNLKIKIVELNHSELNDELRYAKNYIEKQFFFKRNNKSLIKKIINTSVGTFFVIKDEYVNPKLKMQLFYTGKTKDFIKIQEEL